MRMVFFTFIYKEFKIITLKQNNFEEDFKVPNFKFIVVVILKNSQTK